MRNTKKTQTVKYPSMFMIYDTVSKEFYIEECFKSMQDAENFVEDYEIKTNVILEYSPTAVFSPPKKTEWVKESLIE